MLNVLLDFLFPKRCVSCRTLGSHLCDTCLSKIQSVEKEICPMCERSAVDGVTHPGCQTRYSLDGLVSFYRYVGPVKAAIKRLKYSPYLTDLVEILLLSILQSMKGKGGSGRKGGRFSGFTVVVVPLHPQRERERGFNQASLFGKAVAQEWQLDFHDDMLKRVKNTEPQVNLKGKDRRENVIGAFAPTPSYNPRTTPHVLLVDDVWTTGSTLRTCGNVLKRAGAKRVWAMTIAR